jgi:hypothetical protein
MQLSAEDLDAASLAKLGDEARSLLYAGELDTLAARFGYALSYDRRPADAIREELAASLIEAGAARLSEDGWEAPRVGYFKSNDTGLVALVECFLPTEDGAPILVEVIVASNGKETHATLEQVSAAV